MHKLILILLAFFAVFTYIRAFERAEADEISVKPQEISVEIVP